MQVLFSMDLYDSSLGWRLEIIVTDRLWGCKQSNMLLESRGQKRSLTGLRTPMGYSDEEPSREWQNG